MEAREGRLGVEIEEPNVLMIRQKKITVRIINVSFPTSFSIRTLLAYSALSHCLLLRASPWHPVRQSNILSLILSLPRPWGSCMGFRSQKFYFHSAT